MMGHPGRCATIQRRPIMTSRFRKLSHSLYECKYHVVFCPKYRYRIFKDAIGEYAKQQVYQLCKQKEQVVVLELNVQQMKWEVKGAKEIENELAGREQKSSNT